MTDPNNPDATLEIDVATNTEMTSQNLREMGFDGAADVLHGTAHELATKAEHDGYVESARQPDLLPGWEQEGNDPPHPATTMGPISKEDEERAIEYGKQVEEVRRSLLGDDGDMPHGEYGHLKPGEVDPATGRPVPFPTNPGVDPAAE